MIRKFLAKSTVIRELYFWHRCFMYEIPFYEWYNLKKIYHYITCRKFSMNTWHSLATLYELGKKVKKTGIPGDFVECGCCNGGAGAMTTLFLKGRHYWLFDSFEGLPTPTNEDLKYDNTTAKSVWRPRWDKGEMTSVQDLYFNRLKHTEKDVTIVKGLFQDTIPKYSKIIRQIALLHLDGDWYDSTRIGIEYFYDTVTPGGYIMIDDYGHWKGCKKAIDEFLKKKKISPQLISVDYSRVYFRKPL